MSFRGSLAILKRRLLFWNKQGFNQMDIQMDKDTEKAWHGWVAFTRFATWSVLAIVVVLGLMALFLL